MNTGTGSRLSADRASRPRARRWVLLCAAVALALLAYGAIEPLRRFIEGADNGANAVAPSMPAIPATKVDVAPPPAAPVSVDTPGIASADPGNSPRENLDIVLTGVVAHGDAGVALLSVKGQPETAIAIGQEIAGGAVLHAVYPDRIVLRRGGNLESVGLKGTRPAANTAVAPPEFPLAPPVPAPMANADADNAIYPTSAYAPSATDASTGAMLRAGDQPYQTGDEP